MLLDYLERLNTGHAPRYLQLSGYNVLCVGVEGGKELCFFFIYLFYVYKCFVCMSIGVRVCEVPANVGRGLQIDWNWSYGWLKATM